MDNKFIKRIARTNLVSSIIFLILAVIAIAFAIWFTVEIASGSLFGLAEKQEADNGGEAVGLAFAIIFASMLFIIMDGGFMILAIIFFFAGIPLLLNSITLLRIDKVDDMSIITRKLRKSRVVFVVSIVIGSIILLVAGAALVSFIGNGEINAIFIPIFVFAIGLFLIIFSSIEFKKVGKIILEIGGQSEL